MKTFEPKLEKIICPKCRARQIVDVSSFDQAKARCRFCAAKMLPVPKKEKAA